VTLYPISRGLSRAAVQCFVKVNVTTEVVCFNVTTEVVCFDVTTEVVCFDVTTEVVCFDVTAEVVCFDNLLHNFVHLFKLHSS